MPRNGAITFSDLIGKLDLLRVSCEKCGRDGCWAAPPNREAWPRWQGRDKMSTTKHYTIADIEDALEDERAKLVIWQSQALRELRALLGRDAVSGQDGVSK